MFLGLVKSVVDVVVVGAFGVVYVIDVDRKLLLDVISTFEDASVVICLSVTAVGVMSVDSTKFLLKDRENIFV